jgi:hypothetical protein
VHGGGNYHLDALGRSRTTRLIVNENPSLTEQQIHDIWQSYQNVDTNFYQPFPTSVDATQHIDMWMQVIADDAVVISDWPANVGSIQDQICDSTAVSMAAEGYTVHRVPARSVGGVHYTYTNVVMCNDLVLVPSYTNVTVAPHNGEALAVWQAALPQKTVLQIPCQPIVSAAGVMHCIVQHVPVHLGGQDPTAYLVNLNGGEVLTPGSNVEVRWISDDDEAVQSVDLLLSTDGGASFPTVVASGLPRLGAFNWTVPDVCSGTARLRVVARDGVSRTGSDDSDANFAIAGTGCSALSAVYGSGTPGQNGVPTLTATSPVLGQPFDLTIGNAFPGATAVLLVGAAPAATPIAGATLLVLPILPINLPVGGSGNLTLNLSAPTDTVFAGISLYWQAWVAIDPGSPSGLATTAGLQTRFGF